MAMITACDQDMDDKDCDWEMLNNLIFNNQTEDNEKKIVIHDETFSAYTYDFSKLDKSLTMAIPVKKTINYKRCEFCDVDCKIEDDFIYCPQCGFEKLITLDKSDLDSSFYETHNITNNSFLSLKLVGPDSGKYHKCYVRTCADSVAFSKNNIIKNMQYMVSVKGDYKIPKNVIKLAADIYNEIRSNGKVYRGDSKKGIMVSCIYYACRIKKITKTPKFLCTLTDTPEHYLSRGERILHDLLEKNKIHIPQLDDPKIDYVNQYFEALKIDAKYKNFVVELINRADKKSLNIIRDARDTTKCAGTIYMLVMRIRDLKERINKNDVEKVCNVSKTTFIRYYIHLCDNYPKIKKVFKKHRIPMPVEWRN